jgi:hypothetical protein
MLLTIGSANSLCGECPVRQRSGSPLPRDAGRTLTYEPKRAIVNLRRPAGVFLLFMNNSAFPILAILAGSLALLRTVRGADSVVLGHGITNQHYPALPCPADSICLDG